MRTLFTIIFSILSLSVFAQNDLMQKINLAENYLRAGKYEKAKEHYEELVNIQPWNNSFVSSLNNVYLSLKLYDESIRLLTDNIEKQPNNISNYGLLGQTYYTMGEYEAAKQVWSRGLDVQLESEVKYRIISNSMIQVRLYDEAVEVLREAKKNSKNPQTYSLEIANLLSVLMKYNEAAYEYCYLLLDNPSQINVVKGRMSSYLTRLSAKEETTKAVEEFLENNNSTIVQELLAYLYSFSGNYDKAFEIIVDIDRNNEQEGSGIYKFAQEAFSNNDFSASTIAYKFLLDNYPSSQYKTLAEMGYARSLLNKLESRFYNNSDWKPISAPDTTNIMEFEELLQILQKLSNESNPSHIIAESRYYIGLILKNNYLEYKTAREQFDYVIQNFPRSKFEFLSYLERGEVNILLNEFENAKNDFLRISRINGVPWEVESKSLLKRAQIEFWEGNFENAKVMLDRITTNMKDNSVNDAIQLTLLMNSAKNDSINAVKFAKSQLLIEQFHFDEAETILANLSQNSEHFLISEIAKFNLAEIKIAQNKYLEAISLLEELTNPGLSILYPDKALFLCAETYNYGINNKLKARETYEKLLATFPKSVYLSKSRDAINAIILNEGENL